MFGRQSGLGSSSNSSNLVEFRAGRMNMVGKMVHPDSRKGSVYMTQSDDGLMHFCWKDRTSGKVEDDLIVFPDDFEYKRVEQCKTGRVYVLKFKSSTRRMFFWMQEPKTDKDEEHCRRINELLNNPPSAHQRGGGGGSNDGDLQYMLNNMSQQQLMQLFGGVGQMGGLSSLLGQMNSRTPSSRNTSSSGGASALQTPENISVPRTPTAPKGSKSGSSRSNLNSQSDTAGSASSSLDADASGRSLNIDLSTALSGAEAINQLIADPERVKSLIVHLPESEDADEDRKQQIKDHITSPQFQQALAQFSNALQSAQLGPVVKQFELSNDAVAAAYSGNLEDFVNALEKSLPAGTTMGGEKDSTEKKAEPEVTKEENPPAEEKPEEKQK
ncbi:proteasomal ubiquitin receptor ADRM1 homolog isoform X2 [Drosophila guanche]|uniref:Proteasomal ubiquitin receptor ADRM1 homolog n=1 Tax=Drosophila guanche TaxID=7266 RepID=A0A3B0J1W0_DROGU|nr:proteasomal ubiquitin receptor ADRM1 homolog isoform X2 [Drosophila guanche]SPP75017.1 blast:Proteasomal ubiquitin receptor ADRM1 homolog [Drosophila guanche]